MNPTKITWIKMGSGSTESVPRNATVLMYCPDAQEGLQYQIVDIEDGIWEADDPTHWAWLTEPEI